jgi:hypothetical protein
MKQKLAIVAGAGVVGMLAFTPSSPAASTEYTAKATPSLTAVATPSQLRKFPAKLTISGAVVLPEGVSVANGCSGKVAITIRTRTNRTLFAFTRSVRSTCKYSLTFKTTKKLAKQTLSVLVKFEGNSALTVARAKTVALYAG